MASLLNNQEDIQLTIPSYESQDGITYYILEVQISNTKWTVKHRYSEFVTLHETLVLEHCVEKDILPPKKFIGNKAESFVEKRRLGLETYLISVYKYLKSVMPRVLAVFLELHIYEISFLLQTLACKFYSNGEAFSQKSDSTTFDPVQVRPF